MWQRAKAPGNPQRLGSTANRGAGLAAADGYSAGCAEKTGGVYRERPRKNIPATATNAAQPTTAKLSTAIWGLDRHFIRKLRPLGATLKNI